MAFLHMEINSNFHIGGFFMQDMIVKSVDILGDAIVAIKDENGNVWAGVSYFCNTLGMSEGQKDRQCTER